jgi:hypothetical protein
MPARDPWPEYDREIERIRERLALPEPFVPYEGPDEVDPVQLSVRIPPRLKHAIGQAAKRRRQTVQAFVNDALEEAVEAAMNPFAGIAARMTAEFRAELGRSIDSGAYADAAAEIDRAEGWDR